MKLSIAMCTYNGAKYLREHLGSIASQRVLPDELIVCDDGSTDSTREIIEGFIFNSPVAVRLYVNEKVNGLFVASEPEAMAAALAKVLGDPGFAAQLGSNGAQIVAEKWSLDRAVDRLENELKKVLAAKQSESTSS